MENLSLNAGIGAVVRGLFGAFVGALIFGAAWGIPGIIFKHYFFLLASVLISIGAFLGYRLFEGKRGAPTVIAVCVCASAFSSLFWNVTLHTYSLYDTYLYVPVKIAVNDFFVNWDTSLWLDVGFGFIAAIIGLFAISGPLLRFARKSDVTVNEKTEEE